MEDGRRRFLERKRVQMRYKVALVSGIGACVEYRLCGHRTNLDRFATTDIGVRKT
jgi:hypothetical protein